MNERTYLVLLTCLSYHNISPKKNRLAELTDREWEDVVELAKKHSVMPILHDKLKKSDLILPTQIAERLRQEYLKQSLRNIYLFQELDKILRIFQEKNIDVILLKGAYLAREVYSNIGLRGMSDIDLLVRKEDLLRVENELMAFDAIPEDCNRVIAEHNFHFSYKLPNQGGLRLEIHWTITRSDFLDGIDVTELWTRAQPVILKKTSAKTFNPEDLLLHLCIHTAKHPYDMKIRMLCDIGEILKRFGSKLDWYKVGDRAQKWGYAKAVYLVLRIAWELLEVEVPPDWLSAFQPKDFDESYLAIAREQIFNTEQNATNVMPAIVAKFWSTKGLGQKIKLIYDRLLVSKESMSIMYPADANSWRIFLYYPVHLKDILFRYRKGFWQLMKGNANAKLRAKEMNNSIKLRDWLMSE